MTTRQWYFASIDMETSATAEDASHHAIRLPGVGNGAWVEASLGFLEQLAATGKRKSVIPTYILEMLAFLEWDREFDKALGCREPAHRRRILRVRKQGTSSRLRCGRTQFVLADRYLIRRAMEFDWVDLRETAVPILDYVIRAMEDPRTGGWRLVIRLQDEVVRDARSSIKAIVTGREPAHIRLSALRRFLYAFEANHRFAPGAWQQFMELSKYARSQSKRHIKPQLARGASNTIPAIRTTNTLIVSGANPFMDSTPMEVWERWFSPYRP